MTLLGESRCKEPHYVETPCIDLAEDNCVTLMKLPMLDVHEVLAYVHDVAKLRSPKSHIEFYWSWGQKFGAQWSRLGGPSVIPCGLYADETKYGGPFSQEKVLGIFLNLVLHRPRSIRYSRFCIFSVRSALMLGTRTLYPIFRRIVWGFHLAYKGVRPDGSALCSDGATFLCTELRGDLAWHKMIWNFKNVGWQAKDVCWFCKARSEGHMHYTEFGEGASWVPTIYQDTWAWAAETLPMDNLCPLLALPGFCVETIRLCSMHNVNLGILQVCNGSALILRVLVYAWIRNIFCFHLILIVGMPSNIS